MSIRCVLFDIDNTLYSYDAAHAVAFAKLTAFAGERLGLSAAEFQALHRRTNEVLKGRMGEVAAVHNRLIRYQNMMEELGEDLKIALEMNELYWGTLLEAARPTPGAAETLRELHRRGIRVGIGTDMTARLQFLKLERLGLLEYVNFLVSSEEAGAEKPDPALFRLCVEKARCAPEECLFVGDSLEKDALGAARCGLKGVWFRPEGGELRTEVPQIGALQELLSGLD
jgi:putative hydrolase of the HAD superfamily